MSLASLFLMGTGEQTPLADAFWAVSRRMRQVWRETLAPWDVSPSQGRALDVLVRLGPMRLRDLAEHLRVAARSVTEVVDGLEERGLVARRPDPADRRATTVAVTDEGERVARAIRAGREASTDRLFGVLDDAERAELERLLRRLADFG